MATSRDQNQQQWTYNDLYRYPIPRGKEDPWEVLLEPLLAKDKIQCDGWKEEVQNLLIFAGLFSAVVTSFVVESSKDLQPDPNTLLLSHIATLIGNTTNNTVANIPPQIQLSPSPSSYRINALWFASLVLSLTTVLVGIVSLQWIREHQRYSGLPPQEKFSVFCMRKEALKAWYVPQIFAGLPLLLQGALSLYLTGLVDHLLVFGPSVAIPGIIFIALSLFFLLATTVLPTLQGLVVVPTHIEITPNLPSPCPYKSPQSQAFRRLITTFHRSFLAARWLVAQVQWLIMHYRKITSRYNPLATSQPRFIKTSHRFPSILPVWDNASWIDVDWSWLRLHDYMFLNITGGPPPYEYYSPPKSLYDAVKGIRSIALVNRMNTSEPCLFAQFHCLHDISSSFVGTHSNISSLQSCRNTYFQWLLIFTDSSDFKQAPLLSQKLARKLDSNFVSEENTLAILNIIDPYHRFSPTLARHFAECNFRFLAAVYSEIWPLFRDGESRKSPPLMISPQSLGNAIWNIRKSGNETEFVHQWALSINRFFSTIINSSSDDPGLLHSFHAHIFFRRYLNQFIHWIYPSTKDTSDPGSLAVVNSTINEISMALNNPPNKKLDFLFYTASDYAITAMGMVRPKHPIIISAVSGLIEALRDYKARRGQEILSVEAMMKIPRFLDREWWNFLISSEEKLIFGSLFEVKQLDPKLPDSPLPLLVIQEASTIAHVPPTHAETSDK